jgi:hypothetical protein
MHLDRQLQAIVSRQPTVAPRRAAVAALLSATLIGSLVCCASLAQAVGRTGRAAAANTPLSENEFFHAREVTETYITGHGLASGTVTGVGSTKMTILNDTKAVGEFTSGNAQNSVTAKFSATYSVSGKYAHFQGTVTSLHGTGSYAGAVGQDIKFRGTMNRVTLTLSMSATGEWHA